MSVTRDLAVVIVLFLPFGRVFHGTWRSHFALAPFLFCFAGDGSTPSRGLGSGIDARILAKRWRAAFTPGWAEALTSLYPIPSRLSPQV